MQKNKVPLRSWFSNGSFQLKTRKIKKVENKGAGNQKQPSPLTILVTTYCKGTLFRFLVNFVFFSYRKNLHISPDKYILRSKLFFC